MNDQLNGQLTDSWVIPTYARELLWVETDSGCVRTEGKTGLFTLPAPADVVTIRWGGEGGAVLARLSWRADSLGWDGAVRVGGFIDSMHITEIDALKDSALVVLHVGGQPLKPTAAPYPDARQRRRSPYARPDYYEGIDDSLDETHTTWILLDDSPLVMLAQDALVSKLRVWCFGRLAANESGWGAFLALPLLLEGITLFGG